MDLTIYDSGFLNALAWKIQGKETGDAVGTV